MNAPASPRRLVVLDVETADAQHSQICAIALVQIEGDRIAGEWSSLVCPADPPAERNTAVHGLAWKDLHDQPSLAAVWPVVLGLLEGAEALVAHYASFDKGALERACLREGLAPLTLPWHCTVALARQAWPSLPDAKLPTLARHLKVELKHHDALSDAKAAARVYLEASRLLARPGAAPRPPAPSPVVGEERVGSEGKHSWTWRLDRDRADLALDGKRLLALSTAPGGARSVVVYDVSGGAVASVSVSGPALGRLDALLLESLRAAVSVAKASHRVELSAEAWKKIAEGRPGAERRAA